MPFPIILIAGAKQLFIGAMLTAANEAKDAIVESAVQDAKSSLRNSIRDRYESVITGKRTLQQWAEIAIKPIEKIKQRIAEESTEDTVFVGGKLHFEMSPQTASKVVISFELYYLESGQQWHKVGAESDLYASNFTNEALLEIRSHSVVTFEVE
ncbi:MAG: hypothetical protein FWG64_11205 [Firmicutes bacterium]|nr:hypothetical protein [Bacillota bacterium]